MNCNATGMKVNVKAHLALKQLKLFQQLQNATQGFNVSMGFKQKCKYKYGRGDFKIVSSPTIFYPCIHHHNYFGGGNLVKLKVQTKFEKTSHLTIHLRV
jgi:hypothetical protein